MATYLFVCPPFRGHCTPMLLQAAALARRGHAVGVALASECASWVQSTNRTLPRDATPIVHLPWGVQLSSPAATAQLRARICRERTFMYGAALYTAGELLPVIAKMYENLPALIAAIESRLGAPDALVIDSITLPGFDLAAILGVPHVALCSLPLNLAAPAPCGVPRSFTGFTPADLRRSCAARAANALQPLRYELMLGCAVLQLGAVGVVVAVARARAALRARHPEAFPTLPDQWEYLRRSAVLVTTAFGFEAVRPLPSNVVLVGPHVPPAGAATGAALVDVALHRWLDACEAEGTRVVYVAFGSMVPLPRALAQAILRGLSALQLKEKLAILWSTRDAARLGLATASTMSSAVSSTTTTVADEEVQEAAQLASRIEVRVESWVKQPAVLAHSAVALFVTHCGMNSVMEALHCGVPLLGVPMWNDQIDVAARIVSAGAGLRLDWKRWQGWHASAPEGDLAGWGRAASLREGPRAFARAVEASAAQLLRERSFGDAAARTARAMRSVGGVEYAADLIERCPEGGLSHFALERGGAAKTSCARAQDCFVRLVCAWLVALAALATALYLKYKP